MFEKDYSCDSCKTALPFNRARVHCQICPDYDSCADCHVTESVSGTHHTEHDYEVYSQGGRVLIKSTSAGRGGLSQETPLQAPTTDPGASISQIEPHSTTYWGPFITPTKTLSPNFSRLITAIFAHFDAVSAGVLQPHEFCALMLASGYSTEEFPPLTVSTNQSASPTDLHELDAWLARWYRSFPLDHRMATREFPSPPPITPVNGRIRKRDEFLHAMMYPPAPVVLNGSPILLRLGLEQYFIYQVLLDPANLSARLNHLLGALPRLIDPGTGRTFEVQLIPRACFPLIPDPEEEEKRRVIERQASEARDAMLQMQIEEERRALEASHASNLLISQALSNVSGGWRTDSNGNRYYQEGYIR